MTIFRFIDISPHSKQIFSNFSRLEVRYIQFVAKMLQFKLKNRKKDTTEIFFKTISNNSNKKYRLLHDLIKIPYEPQKSEPHEESEERNSAVPSTLATTKIFLLPCSKPVDASRAKEKEREKQKQRKRERETVVPIPGSFPRWRNRNIDSSFNIHLLVWPPRVHLGCRHGNIKGSCSDRQEGGRWKEKRGVGGITRDRALDGMSLR